MKKLGITKEQFEESVELKKQYGNLAYVNESGSLYKTDKGKILKFVKEAREYINDDSIESDTADEFIIFDDPDIFTKIANVQKKEGEKIQDEVKDGEVKPKEVAKAASAAAATAGAIGQIGSAAINTAGNIATSKTGLGIAAAIGYKKVLDKAGEIGAKIGDQVGQNISDWMYGDEMAELDKKGEEIKQQSNSIDNDYNAYAKQTNLAVKGQPGSGKDIFKDKRAWNYATALQSGRKVDDGRGNVISPEKMKGWLKDNGYKIRDDGIVQKIDAKGATTAAASAAAGAGAAGTTTGASGAAAGGWSLFGMSAATVGWILAGVAAAAIITPYIYDKVRACTKTWMADIIAEVKFKADGKNYRCFYDLKKNKWVLTYADVKWSSYLDNKLDKETIDEFFASKFFKQFLDRCKKTFAFLFSTGRNEVVFKALPEIKDAPKELKSILEKIYDNKGAISKNMFSGSYED